MTGLFSLVIFSKKIDHHQVLSEVLKGRSMYNNISFDYKLRLQKL